MGFLGWFCGGLILGGGLGVAVMSILAASSDDTYSAPALRGAPAEETPEEPAQGDASEHFREAAEKVGAEGGAGM